METPPLMVSLPAKCTTCWLRTQDRDYFANACSIASRLEYHIGGWHYFLFLCNLPVDKTWLMMSLSQVVVVPAFKILPHNWSHLEMPRKSLNDMFRLKKSQAVSWVRGSCSLSPSCRSEWDFAHDSLCSWESTARHLSPLCWLVLFLSIWDPPFSWRFR